LGLVAQRTHYAYDTLVFDFRELILDSKSVGKISLAGSCLDDLLGRNALYKETGFQSSTAQRADFSGSEFDYAQMSPFYARGASFKDCKMTWCYLMGIGPRFHPNNPSEPIPGNFSDLRDCDFSNVVATRCGFDRCDFKGARFTNAKFVDCQFDAADLTEVDFGGVSFEGCDFSWTELPDKTEIRALVNQGNNKALDTIKWCEC
jgi:uncharacterized protein YjbI with pentapeptide repeats